MRYQAMVDLEHPEVQACAEQLPNTGDRLALLQAAAALLRQRFAYINVRGYTPIEDMVKTGTGNCLSLSVMLAALLRRSGFAPSAVHVALGNYRGFWVENIHAWVMVQTEPGDLLWMVDPNGFTLKQVRRTELLREFSFVLLFHDQVLLTGDQRTEYFIGTPVLSEKE